MPRNDLNCYGKSESPPICTSHGPNSQPKRSWQQRSLTLPEAKGDCQLETVPAHSGIQYPSVGDGPTWHEGLYYLRKIALSVTSHPPVLHSQPEAEHITPHTVAEYQLLTVTFYSRVHCPLLEFVEEYHCDPLTIANGTFLLFATRVRVLSTAKLFVRPTVFRSKFLEYWQDRHEFTSLELKYKPFIKMDSISREIEHCPPDLVDNRYHINTERFHHCTEFVIVIITDLDYPIEFDVHRMTDQYLFSALCFACVGQGLKMDEYYGFCTPLTNVSEMTHNSLIPPLNKLRAAINESVS